MTERAKWGEMHPLGPAMGTQPSQDCDGVKGGEGILVLSLGEQQDALSLAQMNGSKDQV